MADMDRRSAKPLIGRRKAGQLECDPAKIGLQSVGTG